MIATMRDLAGLLMESGVATAESIVGCTPDELAEFRRVRGVAESPAQYGERNRSAQTWPSLLEFLLSELAYVRQFLGK